ncbi:hypothetical protein ACFU3J_17545 [Streptomyces sp. NPDC057411]|uniref:hypothetical protein n=1 Tax=unclassified Streptomyces TaxID=2593676 RepID=UPI00362BE7FC
MSASLTPVQSIDATTAALQEELPRLEQLQQELEKELAAVSERVLSVRKALTALLALAETPAPRAVQAAPEPAVAKDETAVEAAPIQEAGPVPAPRKAATTRAAGERKTTPAKANGRKERFPCEEASRRDRVAERRSCREGPCRLHRAGDRHSRPFTGDCDARAGRRPGTRP